jgi:serine-type D-Ala-D-Ala carboxypeptidase/endopeptidase
MSYEALLGERITGPLGMTSTTITLSGEQKRRVATGYDQALRPVRLWDFDALAGAAAIRSTANDLLTFAAAHLELVDNPLKPAMRRMRAFRRPTGLPSEDQAMGWQIFTRYEPEIVFHQGGTHGFHAVLALQPATRRAVVVLSNSLARVDDMAKHSLEPRYPLEK